MNYYLAGPMSGIPQYNYPAFNYAANQLRAADLTIFNPAELDHPDMQVLALASKTGLDPDKFGETWGDVLARDVKLIADHIDGGIILLPGWQASRGARLELFCALQKKLPVYVYTGYRDDVGGALMHSETHEWAFSQLMLALGGAILDKAA